MMEVTPADPSLLPPKKFQLMQHTEQSFINAGNKHLRFFVDELDLSPDAEVLEIGSGNGRIACALTTFLKGGCYWGLEVMNSYVKWCSSAYECYSNFHFRHINVYNRHYNRLTFKKARDYIFPFPDACFDFIFLTSVFTHMRTEEVDNYLKEISRMLKPGGTTFITFFLINKETLELVRQQKAHRNFQLLEGPLYTDNLRIPESAIAYDENFVFSLYRKHNLVIDGGGIHYGRWRSPETLKHIRHNQDRIIAAKPVA